MWSKKELLIWPWKRKLVWKKRNCPVKNTDRDTWIMTMDVQEKNQTHVKKVGEHPRISVWHLLMNLKNNYLLKKLLKWANKKCKHFNIYKKKKKKRKKKNKEKQLEISLFLCTNNLHDIIYSSWDIECDRLKLVIMGHSLPFKPPPLETKKIRILKKRKQLLEISPFYKSVPNPTIMWGTVPQLRSETDRIFCHFGPFFAILPPLTTREIKI